MAIFNVFSCHTYLELQDYLPPVTGKFLKIANNRFSLKTQAKLSRLCEQDKVVHALEEKLQQLHKEKVGQPYLLYTSDVTFYTSYQDTDKTKVKRINSMMQNIKCNYFYYNSTRLSKLCYQPAKRQK